MSRLNIIAYGISSSYLSSNSNAIVCHAFYSSSSFNCSNLFLIQCQMHLLHHLNFFSLTYRQPFLAKSALNRDFADAMPDQEDNF